MKNLLVILICLSAWTYSSAQSSYFPVEPGKKWTYAFGKDIYGGTPYENYITEVAIQRDKEIIDGKSYYVLTSSSGLETSENSAIKTYVGFSDDGAILSKVEGTDKFYTTMNSNPKVGDEFLSPTGGTSKVISLNASITSPTDSYDDCLLIEMADSDLVMRSYYKKGVGLVVHCMVVEGTEKIFSYLLE